MKHILGVDGTILKLLNNGSIEEVILDMCGYVGLRRNVYFVDEIIIREMVLGRVS